jgi:uncharacterized protein YjiS (DUF1127 family)
MKRLRTLHKRKHYRVALDRLTNDIAEIGIRRRKARGIARATVYYVFWDCSPEEAVRRTLGRRKGRTQ